jgi:hypothetical protein
MDTHVALLAPGADIDDGSDAGLAHCINHLPRTCLLCTPLCTYEPARHARAPDKPRSSLTSYLSTTGQDSSPRQPAFAWGPRNALQAVYPLYDCLDQRQAGLTHVQAQVADLSTAAHRGTQGRSYSHAGPPRLCTLHVRSASNNSVCPHYQTLATLQACEGSLDAAASVVQGHPHLDNRHASCVTSACYLAERCDCPRTRSVARRRHRPGCIFTCSGQAAQHRGASRATCATPSYVSLHSFELPRVTNRV